MDTGIRAIAPTGTGLIGLLSLLSIVLLSFPGPPITTASAGDAVRLVNLGEDRNLVVRTSGEGLVLHFMGKRSSPDDNVVLLPDRRYAADVRWLAGPGTVVVAAGRFERPVDVYGFDSDGRRFYRRSSRQEEGERLDALPGDSLVVVSSRSLAAPPQVLRVGTGEWLDGYLNWSVDMRDFPGRPVLRQGNLLAVEGGLLVMVDRGEVETMISAWAIGEDAPRWEVRAETGFRPTVIDLGSVESLAGELSRFTRAEAARPIADGADWNFPSVASSDRRIVLAGTADGNPVVIAFDRGSGQFLAAVRLPGQSVVLLAEPGGDRLLAVVQDRHHRGHLLVLDQSKLEFQTEIANPGGWYILERWSPRVLSPRDGTLCLVPDGVGGPGASLTVPRSLVVTWGETMGVHWLDAPADLTDAGRILLAREYRGDGDQEFRIEEWNPSVRPGP